MNPNPWPHVRVGDRVRLKNGKAGVVITITKANDVLRGKTELEALIMGPRLQAIYGQQWQKIYFEGQIMTDENMVDLIQFTPNDVGEVITL